MGRLFRNMLVFVIYSVLLFSILKNSNAASISGNVYDYSLELTDSTIIKINTTPEQTYIAKNGTYSFELPKGKYQLTAYLDRTDGKYFLSQEISVLSDGNYVIDLILFPDIREEENIERPNINLDDTLNQKTTNNNSYLWISVIVIGVLILIVGYQLLKQKKTKNELRPSQIFDKKDNLPDQIIDFLKAHGGRAFQKDIRKQFPLSEAKISLVLLEMEHNNLIKKIKKGKGNIIILN